MAALDFATAPTIHHECHRGLIGETANRPVDHHESPVSAELFASPEERQAQLDDALLAQACDLSFRISEFQQDFL
jgi:hypothetical protein